MYGVIVTLRCMYGQASRKAQNVRSWPRKAYGPDFGQPPENVVRIHSIFREKHNHHLQYGHWTENRLLRQCASHTTQSSEQHNRKATNLILLNLQIQGTASLSKLNWLVSTAGCEEHCRRPCEGCAASASMIVTSSVSRTGSDKPLRNVAWNNLFDMVAYDRCMLYSAMLLLSLPLAHTSQGRVGVASWSGQRLLEFKNIWIQTLGTEG